MEYRKDIDGLRALSVLGVVFFHAGMSTFSGGFIGVDVFFVITGYLISIIILYDAGRGEFSFLSFYERRIRRIAPILVCVVLCSSVASYFLLTPREMEVFSRLSVSSLLLSSNIELLISNESYFGFLYRAKPLIHAWSLSLEEQFYFIFPALLILAWRRGERFLLWSALMVAALSLALAEWGARHHPNASFYLLPTRGWEFLVGFLAAHVTRLYGEKKNSLLSMAGLAAVLFSIFFYDSRIPHPGLYTVLPVLGTACILIYGTSGTLTATLLKVKPLGLIGLMSYSVYLWHQPFFSFYEALTFQPQTEGYVLLTAVTLGLSYLTWRFIEQPARDRVRCPRRPLFTSLAAVMGILIAFGLAGYGTGGFAGRAAFAQFVGLEEDSSTQGYQACENPLVTSDPPLDYCRYRTPDVTAVILGDSHAEDRFFGLDQKEKTHRWMLLGNRSCAPVLDVFVMLEGGGPDCSQRLPKIFHLLQKADGINMVVLSFGYMYAQERFETADIVASGLVPDDFKVRDLRDPTAPKREALYRGLERTLVELNKRGLSVVLALDIPDVTFFPSDCLRGLTSCHFSRDAVLARQQFYRTDMMRLAEAYGAKVFDPLNFICNPESGDCSVTREGKSLYRDSHHLSLYGSRLYGQAFADWLGKQPYPWGQVAPAEATSAREPAKPLP